MFRGSLDRKWSRKPKIKILMSTNNYLASSGSKPYRLIEVKAINVGELPTTLSMAVDSIRKYSVPSAQNKQAKHMNPIRLKWN